MKKENLCERYFRGNIMISAKQLSQVKCKLVCSIIALLAAIVISFFSINWNASIVFYAPTIKDIQLGFTKDITQQELTSPRWIQKQDYITEIFKQTCEKTEYNLLSNLNLRILGFRIPQSIMYNCISEELYLNLQIKPHPHDVRLVCNETYGNHWVVRNDRFHPLEYSYIENSYERVNRTTMNYKETCLIYQANDLIKGTWKPMSI